MNGHSYTVCFRLALDHQPFRSRLEIPIHELESHVASLEGVESTEAIVQLRDHRCFGIRQLVGRCYSIWLAVYLDFVERSLHDVGLHHFGLAHGVARHLLGLLAALSCILMRKCFLEIALHIVLYFPF